MVQYLHFRILKFPLMNVDMENNVLKEVNPGSCIADTKIDQFLDLGKYKIFDMKHRNWLLVFIDMFIYRLG